MERLPPWQVGVARCTGRGHHHGDLFTNEDLPHGRLVYQHDNSETMEDDTLWLLRSGRGQQDMAWEEVRVSSWPSSS